MSKKKPGKAPEKKQQSKKFRLEPRRILTGLLAILMILAILLPVLESATVAEAASQSELKNQISSLQGSASEAKAKKKELQAQLDALNKDKSNALARKKVLDQQLAAIDSEVAATQSQINTYNDLISVQETALAEAQEKEQTAYETFCKRARSMEEAGEVSYLSVLFGAKDYTDLLDRLALVNEIMVYDNSVVNALAAAREEVETTLSELTDSRSQLQSQKATLDTQRAEQAAKVKEAEELLTELKSQASAAEELVRMQEEEEEKINKQIAAKQKELDKLIASQQITFTTGSGYAYPLPAGNYTVTSQFGPRTHPITGKYSNHTGSDIAAAGGTSVYAVQGGVVQTSAYAPSSYGEYVVINHGNGITTLYAHMQRGSRTVKEGDIVTQGQTLGKVGSTGSSTGNHLHLEMRKNGVRQNPLTMFPGIKFTYW